MKKTLFKTLLLLLVISAIGSATYAWNLTSLNQEPIKVRIQSGDTLGKLATKWEAQGWLPSAYLLRIQAKLLDKEQVLRVGEYVIDARVTGDKLLSILEQAKPIQYRLTFVEGTRLRDAIVTLKNAEYLKQDMPNLSEKSIQKLLKLKQNPEGLLYPDTYLYSYNESVSNIIKQSYERGQKQLQEAWDKRAKNLPYKTPYEALIMASIIEKETGVEYERPQIAGVFVRRLQKGMRLETDPTVIYGAKDYKGNLRYRHLRDASNPYNTYRIFGLPPTPIAFAGRKALDAALNPADGEELYFVAKGDGSHKFSRTLAEHSKAVRKYQIEKRRKDYRSSPPPAAESVEKAND